MGIERNVGTTGHFSVRRAGILSIGAVALLAGCGGGGGSGSSGGDNRPVTPPPAPPETLFVAQNEWQGAMPGDATQISADEFRRLHAAGELQIVTSTTRQDLERARRENIERELSFLEGQTDLTDDEKALIEEARASDDYLGTPTVTLPSGEEFALLDVGTRIEALARNYRDAHDPAAMLAAYAVAYSVLTDELKVQVPTPESLSGASLEEVMAARHELDAVLESVVDLDRTRLDFEGMLPASQSRMQKATDNNGPCSPTGLARTHWFPLRSFVSPMKQQGKRGTCWAFTAIAALESADRVQLDLDSDLSEQYFVNQTKHKWFPSEFVDGGDARAALNAAAERGGRLARESDWIYNPSPHRPGDAFGKGVEGTAASYVDACKDYGLTPCSESAHQSDKVCSTQNGRTVCAYQLVSYTGGGGRATPARLLWKSGQTFDLNTYRALLASGVSIMAAFPVYDGFRNVGADGKLTDYEKNNQRGSHAVQIVGFLSNEAMTFGPLKSEVGGGGYFIIRNSWGCYGAGDAGYYYIPADYVRDRFSTLEVLELDATRSQRWLDDQSIPGGTSGLTIDPRGTTSVNVRVPTNIGATIGVRQPGASHVRLTVTSDRDGKLFDGQWIVEEPAAPSGILFGNDLNVNFQTTGVRTLTLTARYGTQVVTATKTVYATNTPPELELETFGEPQEGEPFIVTANITDINEPSLTDICNSVTWEVQAPDTVLPGSGCSRTIRFGTAGSRTLRATAKDREGSTSSVLRTFTVQPPPANPYPRVNSGTLYSWDFASNPIIGCHLSAVPSGATVDVRQRSCALVITGPQRPRFEAHLDIENPLNETLSYQWSLRVWNPGEATPARNLPTTTSSPVYPVEPIVFGGLNAANPCAIDVTVVAPQSSRNKQLRVWSGKCIFIENAPR